MSHCLESAIITESIPLAQNLLGLPVTHMLYFHNYGQHFIPFFLYLFLLLPFLLLKCAIKHWMLYRTQEKKAPKCVSLNFHSAISLYSFPWDVLQFRLLKPRSQAAPLCKLSPNVLSQCAWSLLMYQGTEMQLHAHVLNSYTNMQKNS